MASTIANMFVGIGFDFDKNSTKGVESAMDSFKSKAIMVGAAAAGAFGLKKTSDWAQATDDLGKFSERFGVAASDVSAFDRALQHAGGSAGEFQGVIANLSQKQSLTGADKATMLAGAARDGIAGAVQSVIDATDATEGFLKAADAIQGMSPDKQERFFKTMGFSDARVRLLREGRSEIMKTVAKEKQMRDVSDEMTKTSAEFNDTMQNMGTILAGISDHVFMPVTKALTSIVAGMNDWLMANFELITSGIDSFMDLLGDNVLFVAGAMALLTAAKILKGLRALLFLLESIAAVKGLTSVAGKLGKIGRVVGFVGKAVLRVIPIVGALVTAFEAGSFIFDKFFGGDEKQGSKGSAAKDANAAASASQKNVSVATTHNVTVDVSSKDDHIEAKVKDIQNTENQQTIDAIASPVRG
jgi:hypothetical protein